MGFESRDYMRPEEPRFISEGAGRGVKWLIAIVAIFSLACDLYGEAFVNLFLHLSLDNILNDLYLWQLISVYLGVQDFLSCVLWGIAFYMVGKEVENLYGTKEFLFLYGLSGFFLSCVFVAISFLLNSNAPLMNAYLLPFNCILMLFACHFPRRNILLFFVFPVQVRILVGIYIAFGFLSLVSSFNAAILGSAICYLLSFSIAYLYYKKSFLITSLFSSSPITASFKGSGDIQMQAMNDADTKAKVDDLLDKISSKGISSLTVKEKEFLKKSSSQF